MIRACLYLGCYLVAAVLIEVILSPIFEKLVVEKLRFLFQWRLLAMTGIVVGMLRGEIAGMCVALIAVLFLCFSQPPREALGAAIVSFSTVAFVAGWAARHLQLRGFASRWMQLTLLLIVEQQLWSLVRRIFWSTTSIGLSWSGLMSGALTGFIGACLLIPLVPRFKVDLDPEEP